MRWTKSLFSIAVFLILTGLFGHTTAASVVSEGYHTDKRLSPGMIVARSAENKSSVQASSKENNNIFGVVASKDDTLVEANDPTDNVQVITDGIAEVLVSDILGEPNYGDPISYSAIEGVGARAVESTRIIGFTVENFSSADTFDNTPTVDVQVGDGTTKTVHIKKMRLSIQAGNHQIQKSSLIPAGVQDVANSLAGGKEVPSIRVILAASLSILGTIVATIILIGAIQSTIISVGRNPFAKKEIYSGMQKTIAMVILMLIISYGLAALFLRF